MTGNQIVRTIHKMSPEQREHLREQMKLRAMSTTFMGQKILHQDKLHIALCAIEGKVENKK